MLFGIDFASPEAWISLVTLIALEVVLGVDNLIVIAIITGRLPEHQARVARRIGLGLAVVMRLSLLAAISWVLGLTQPAFALFGHPLSWKDLVLIGGGFFLIAKATIEIHERVTPHDTPDGHADKTRQAAGSFTVAIIQILFLDLVFSLDSIIVGVGLTPNVAIIAIAIVVTVAVMLLLVDWVSNFVMKNPTIIMLALSFLVMVGMVLVADGFGVHVPKGFVYVAMAFSAAVEALNMLARRAAGRAKAT
jgi:predicted tellurium resistance membrane protein TerC